MKNPGDPPFTRMQGLPAREDTELQTLLDTASRLTRAEVDALVRNLYRAALAAERTGNPTYMACLAADALATMRLHSDPAYRQAVEKAASGPGDPRDALDVHEMLARRGL